nr:hypothetical protein [Tanacetum cinerariifolium]
MFFTIKGTASDKLKKLEKNKDGELVQDKAAKELIFRGTEDKKVVLTFMMRLVDDLAAWNDFPWGEYYWEEFHNKVVNLIDIRLKNHIEYKKYNTNKLPTYTIHGIAWDSNPILSFNRLRQRWGRTGIEDRMTILTLRKNLYRWMTWAASLRMINLMHILDKMDVVLQLERKLVVESLDAKVEKLQLDHDKMAVFFENFKKARPELITLTPDAKEDPSDVAIDGEHMDAVGHPDENEGPNEKEDPSNAAIDGEHMDVVGHPDENEGPNEKEDPSDVTINGERTDTIGCPDETKEPNAQESISYVLNMPVDNGDVLMTDANETMNLADPPSHEFEITSPCGSKKKGDGLDGAKANQEDVPASQSTVKAEVVSNPKRATSTTYIRRSKRHEQGMMSTADNGEVVNEPQLLDSHEVYIPINIKNAYWFLVEFQIRTGVVTFYDTLSGLESWQKKNLDWWLSLRVMMIEQRPQGMLKHGIFKKKDIDPERYNITFEFSNHASKQAGLYDDCGV